MTTQEFVIYCRNGRGYWNGARWVKEESAKTFSSTDEAREEMIKAEIEWTYNILPKKK